MTTIRFLLLTCLMISSISPESTESNFMKSLFADINGRVKEIIDEGREAVDKMNSKIQTFAKSGQIMLDENLPDNNDISNFFKQSVTGTPFELSMNVFHAFCSANLHETLKERSVPEIPKFKLVLMTSCKNYSYSLVDAENMWTNRVFDPKKKTVVLVTGWTTNGVQDPTVYSISKAYMCRGDVNFVALDTANYLDTFYDWAALNTEEIGSYVGKALSLLKNKVQSQDIHLIGHSLGAHIVSAAGRTYFSLTDKLVGRITGLDPAQPCFNEGEQLKGISRGDGEYVDIIHSNPGILGKKEAVGDADFYPNGFDSIPNGCITLACAHSRAWQYYAESIYPGNEHNFLSAKCSSMKRFKLNKCTEMNVPMGYLDKRQNVKGNYFLETNDRSPYGLNATVNTVSDNCGECLE
ncbi:hypothetical protein ACFFRR_004738 [Megaselia abdita]